MTACAWASSEWRRPMSSAAPRQRRRGRCVRIPRNWAAGDQKSLAVEWAPVGAKKCLVARVEILMSDDGAPKMTSFLVEDLDEVLELSD